MRLGELLIEARAITAEQLGVALGRQRVGGGRLGTQLVELGYLSESALAQALSNQLRLPPVTASTIEKVESRTLLMVPAELAARYRVCPVRIDGPRLWLAMSDPTDQHAIAAIAGASGHEVRPMVAPDVLISFALERHYGASPVRTISLAPPPARDVFVKSDPHAPAILLRGSATPDRLTEFPDVYAPPAGTAAPPTAALGDVVGVDGRDIPIDFDETFAARAGLESVCERLAVATSPEAVCDAVLAHLAQDFARVAAFSLRGGHLVGWRGRGAGMSASALRSFAVTLDEAAALASPLSDGVPRLGRAVQGSLGPAQAILGEPGDRLVILLPLLRDGTPIGVLLGVGGDEVALTWGEEYSHLVGRIDLALQMVALRAKLLER